ncbi:MAG: twin-arginine translocation signal domain-containing protein, partial [Planctomycetes bacterium]|nr:twin-arginine translocation signal domain-containing protein [Planctomycetota bacterium]
MEMLTPDQLDRRTVLKGVTLGAGSLLFTPLLQKVAAAAEGKGATPKRVVFIVFDNGFREIDGTLPGGVPLASE